MSEGPLSLPRTRQALERGITDRLHLGAQLYVSVAPPTSTSTGKRARADLAVGESRPGEPLTPDHLMLWLSASKPVTALLLARLWEQGRLALDDPIARFVPEFAAGGKEAVTLRHALTHTGGFRMLDVGWPAVSWEEIVGRIVKRRLEPNWEPGRKAGYHMASSWFVLGETARRLTSRPFDRLAREEVFEPLGAADSWIGMPRERDAAYRGNSAGDRIAPTWNTEAWAPGAAAPPAHAWHEEMWTTRPSPAGGGRGPMRELGRLYEALLEGGGPLLAPQTVEALTTRHRVGMLDHTFRHVIDWGLGFILDSNLYGADTVPYGYGPHASRRTFGHSGYRSVTAFADPEPGLVVALAFNGTPTHEAHERRVRSVLAAVYEDLGLPATAPPAAP